ncbi:MAG: DUF3105 domain-containing protein [Anaerolineales bacterium]
MNNLLPQRERRQARRRTQQDRTTITWALIGIAALALVGFLVWSAIRTAPVNTDARGAMGQAFPIQGAQHILTDSDPGEYNSNPPTSGPHYEEPLPAGFYEAADLAAWGPYPQAHAVHNLEHGYIIFWFNCDLLDENGCEELKTQIRDFINGSPVRKLIAFPWPGGSSALALTSWGYLLDMPVFDANQAAAFINANRALAPEPDAP